MRGVPCACGTTRAGTRGSVTASRDRSKIARVKSPRPDPASATGRCNAICRGHAKSWIAGVGIMPQWRLTSRFQAEPPIAILCCMNEIFLSPVGRPGTQAAEGLPRWRWTVAEIERIAAAGIFNDQDRFELIGGEIVPMSPEGVHHERLRNMLKYRWTRMAPDDVMIVGASQFNLDADIFVNPDILVHPMAIHTDKL